MITVTVAVLMALFVGGVPTLFVTLNSDQPALLADGGGSKPPVLAADGGGGKPPIQVADGGGGKPPIFSVDGGGGKPPVTISA